MIEDLEFNGSCGKVEVSPDGEFLVATGVYPPQVKVYELSQLGMKFERHIDAEVVTFKVPLSVKEEKSHSNFDFVYF